MRRLILVFGLMAALLAGCGTPAAAPATTAGTSLTPVRVAMGYIPDVQFAMFYVAEARGYYHEEGLDVTFDHSDIRDALIQVGQGSLTFANASGDEILLARAQGIPVKLVFQTYQEFPVAIFAKSSTGLASPEALRGKTVGIPGRFGATYVGLLGMLYAAGIPVDDVQIVEIGFTQAAAVREDKVEAASGYFNNEPLILEADGVPVDVLRVGDYINLVSNGIIASDTFVESNPDTVRRFARATARGLQDTLDDPDAAFQDSLQFIPELEPERRPQELNKLKETITLWRSDATATHGPGYSDPAAWETTHRFLRDSGLLTSDVNVDEAFTNDLRE